MIHALAPHAYVQKRAGSPSSEASRYGCHESYEKETKFKGSGLNSLVRNLFSVEAMVPLSRWG